jgi:hypothetical protein
MACETILHYPTEKNWPIFFKQTCNQEKGVLFLIGRKGQASIG